MPVLHLLLIVAAFLCFVFAAVGRPIGNINLTALGLALWVLTLLLPRV
jgi:hypothetical protein